MITRFFGSVVGAARRSWVSGLVSAGTFVVAIGAFTDFLTERLGTLETAALALAATAAIAVFAPPLVWLAQFLRSLRQAEVTVEEVAGPVPRHRGLQPSILDYS